MAILSEVTGNPNYSMFNVSLKEDWSKSRKFCLSLDNPKDVAVVTKIINGME